MNAGPQYYFYDGARIPAESTMGKELAKWERPNYNPDAAENRYPRMLYRAQHRPDGKRSVGEVNDNLFGGAPGAAEQWSARCRLIVQNETEHKRALENGWRESQSEALEHLEAKDNAVSELAATRAYEDRNMSELAKAEAREVESNTLKHLAEIPEKPKPGRRKKVAVPEVVGAPAA